MTYTYKTKGVCSRAIRVELDGDIVKNVQFMGGCNGNTQGVASLAIGQKASDVIEKLKDIKCGIRSTSCPAQLSIALQEALEADLKG